MMQLLQLLRDGQAELLMDRMHNDGERQQVQVAAC
jgi:hypothetical protein